MITQLIFIQLTIICFIYSGCQFEEEILNRKMYL